MVKVRDKHIEPIRGSENRKQAENQDQKGTKLTENRREDPVFL